MLLTALTEQAPKQIFRLSLLKRRLAALFHANNLDKLAQLYGTDKFGYHFYTQHYASHFAALRHKQLNILEIGIGGNESSTSGGESLRVWKTYFPKSLIFGLDIIDKSGVDEHRIKCFRGDQSDEKVLQAVVDAIGKIDIIIDDGSHFNDHVIKSFKFLFPKMAADGIYVVEDTQTSYWPTYGGSTTHKSSEVTMLGFLKSLTDGLNFQEYIADDYEPSYWDQHIVGMCFYHNLVFIQKGENNEPICHNARPEQLKV